MSIRICSFIVLGFFSLVNALPVFGLEHCYSEAVISNTIWKSGYCGCLIITQGTEWEGDPKVVPQEECENICSYLSKKRDIPEKYRGTAFEEFLKPILEKQVVQLSPQFTLLNDAEVLDALVNSKSLPERTSLPEVKVATVDSSGSLLQTYQIQNIQIRMTNKRYFNTRSFPKEEFTYFRPTGHEELVSSRLSNWADFIYFLDPWNIKQYRKNMGRNKNFRINRDNAVPYYEFKLGEVANSPVSTLKSIVVQLEYENSSETERRSILTLGSRVEAVLDLALIPTSKPGL